MPRMRGKEASRLIRDTGYDGIIIGITGNAMDEDVSSFIKSGADIVLPKPFNFELFKKHVDELRKIKEKTDDLLVAV